MDANERAIWNWQDAERCSECGLYSDGCECDKRATPAGERDSPAEIMGMWPSEPGHTFIRGLWRVSEKMIGELRTEEYELLSENPDELDAVRADNARLRAALGDVLRFVQINEPDNTYADLVVNLDMDGWQTGTRSKLGTDDLGHALKRAAAALGSDEGRGRDGA